MIDKSDIRNEILSKIDSIEVNNLLKMQLDSLDVIDKNKNLNMKAFYSEFTKIISWDEIHGIQYRNDFISLNETVRKIFNILAWAKKQWVENAINGNLDKVIMCFIIVDRMFLKPEEDLSWDFDFTKIREKIEKTLPTVSYDVSDTIPDYAGYSDRKFHSDYRKALDANNYRGIFLFFNAIDRGMGLHTDEDEFLKAMIRISSLIDIKLLSNIIGKYSPPLMFLVINTLSKKSVLEILENYTYQNPLPLLIGLKRIFEQEKNKNDKDRNIDWEYIERCSNVLEKIADYINEDSLYNFISESIRSNRNKIWHLVFTAFIAKNDKYLNDYSANIDFTYDIYGEESFDTFMHYGTNEKLNDLSKMVFSHFIAHFKSIEYLQHPFLFSSYYKYFLHAISVISENDYSKYLRGLEDISISLLRSLYSWDQKEKDQYFTQLIYWILAAKNFSYADKKNKISLHCTYKILNDERKMNLLKVKIGDTLINFDELKLLLEGSENVHSIVLPAKEKAIELRWSN